MQKIFDVNNKEDMKLLWSIVPDNAKKIKKSTESRYFDRLYRDNGDILVVCFLNINWHDKTEITRPVNYEDMIGCVGWFWDNEEDIKDLAVLQTYDTHDDMGFYFKAGKDLWYKFFTPAKKSELKFYGEDK